MKHTNLLKGLIIIFGIIVTPRFVFAGNGKPCTALKINYAAINHIIADTTLPEPGEKPAPKKEEVVDKTVEVVKVIPKARRQPIPVPVKVNVQPVKIIKPKIIKPVVKPVIKILH